jgi:hypothetical protein
MGNWLKTFWNDLGNKRLFFHKYVLPGLAIFFTWGLLGHLYLISMNINSLTINQGRVTGIAVKFEPGVMGKYKYYPLKIRLANYPKEFRLSDTYKRDFSDLQKQILLGDTITLFSRNKLQTIIGWGKQIDIYQINKRNQTLFSISKVIAEKKSQAKIFTIFSLILWPWYFIYLSKKIKK